MAGESFFTLLNSAQQNTADVFAKVNATMTQDLQLRQRANEFELGMAAKGLEIGESQRYHDEQIGQMKVANEIRAAESEVRKQLLPLQRQVEMMRLQAYQDDANRKLMDDKLKAFDQLTYMGRDKAGFSLMTTGSAEQAQKLVDHNMRYRADLMAGKPVDLNGYNNGIDKIIDEYKDEKVEDTKSWDAKMSYLINSISPAAGKAYDKNHPFSASSRNSIATQYLTATRTDKVKMAASMGDGFADTDIAGLVSAGAKYDTNQDRIEILSKRAEELSKKVLSTSAAGEDMPEVKKYKEQATIELADTQKEISRLSNENMKMIKNHSQGNYGPVADDEIDVKKPGDGKPPPKGRSTSDLPEKPKPILGFNNQGGSDDEGKKIQQKLALTENAINPETKKTKGKPKDNELRGIDLGYASGEYRDRPNKETIQRISGLVENNILRIGQEDVITREKMARLIKTLDSDIAIPIDSYVANVINSSNSSKPVKAIKEIPLAPDSVNEYFAKHPWQRSGLTFTGIESLGRGLVKDEAFITIGPSAGGKIEGVVRSNAFKSVDEIYEYINNIKNKGDKELALRKIYSSLVAASVVNAFPDK